MDLKPDKRPADERQRARGAARAPTAADPLPSVSSLAAKRRERERTLTYPPLSAARRTLPLAVFGSSAANSTMRGYL
jgi:hypothetical protein